MVEILTGERIIAAQISLPDAPLHTEAIRKSFRIASRRPGMVVSAAKTGVFVAVAPQVWELWAPHLLGAVRKIAGFDFSDSH